jgi:hypothetical protein
MSIKVGNTYKAKWGGKHWKVVYIAGNGLVVCVSTDEQESCVLEKEQLAPIPEEIYKVTWIQFGNEKKALLDDKERAQRWLNDKLDRGYKAEIHNFQEVTNNG